MKLIDQLLPLLAHAGEEILKIYNQDFKVTLKRDASPVTEADLISDKILREGLKKISPLPIITEETYQGEIPEAPSFWLIDPIDGTKDFVEKTDEFCLLISKIENERPTFGVIYAPALNLCFWAEFGKGAYEILGLKTNKVEHKKLPYKTPPTEITMTCSRHHAREKSTTYAKQHKIHNVIFLGSAIKFCSIARGDCHLYPRLHKSSLWDIAAGDLLVHESGGSVIDLTTNQIPKYNLKSIGANELLATHKSINL